MNENERFLRLPDVEKMTGLRKTTIYGLIERGEFPEQKRIASRVVIWLESDVRKWMTQRLAEAKAA